MRYNCREIRFADVSSVLCRVHGVPFTPQDFETPNGRYISAEWNALVMAWLHGMAGVVINRIRPELWYKTQLNVPDLVSLMPGIGFRLPRALVTTSIDDANEFCRTAAGPVRYSALTLSSRYRIQTAADREKLSALKGSLPFYLTDWIYGREIDAFVVGQEVVLVDSDGRIDDGAPTAIKAHCAAISDAFKLAFYKLSLAASEDDDWYCLGLDRFPQLYQCGPEAQTRIAGALARILSADVG
jgi:hypothetical protein